MSFPAGSLWLLLMTTITTGFLDVTVIQGLFSVSVDFFLSPQTQETDGQAELATPLVVSVCNLSGAHDRLPFRLLPRPSPYTLCSCREAVLDPSCITQHLLAMFLLPSDSLHFAPDGKR